MESDVSSGVTTERLAMFFPPSVLKTSLSAGFVVFHGCQCFELVFMTLGGQNFAKHLVATPLARSDSL
uniref:Uncharacterized protein n=1 Tax=Ditylenchus dipsaci TaxID=166011 RepID=A0A915E6R5_9BILA